MDGQSQYIKVVKQALGKWSLLLGLLLGAGTITELHAASPYAGFYTGYAYISVSGTITVPESPIGPAFYTVDSDGNISGSTQGLVDSSGTITWLANELGFTTGTISGGVLAATTTVNNGGAITTTRISASNNAGGFGQGGTFAASLATVNPMGSVGVLNGIIHGGGKYVVVGDGGTISWSVNGVDWFKGVSPSGKALFDVAYGNGVYVVVGDGGTLLTSPDAITWTARSTPVGVADIYCVAFGNGRFVAGPLNSDVMTSTDGISWTTGTTGVPGTKAWEGVDYVNNQFVAWTYVAGLNGKALVTSADGLTWSTYRTMANANYYHAAHGNGVYVITGSGNKTVTFTASDASNFANNSIAASVQGIAFDGSKFVGTTGTGAMYQSTDGVSWSLLSTTEDTDPKDMIFANNAFRTAGVAGILSSTDGTAWENSRRNFTGAGVKQVVRLGSSIVALAGGSSIYNGLSSFGVGLWTGSDLFDATYDPMTGFHVLVGQSGTIARVNLNGSIGTTQSYPASGTTDDLFGVGAMTSGANVVAAVGANGRIVTSVGTTTWTVRTSPVTTTLRDVEGSASTLVAVGDHGVILSSTDGVTWTVRASGTTARLNRAYYNTSTAQFTAVGDNGTILTSSDGVAWAVRSSGSGKRLVGIARATGTTPRYVAAAEDGTLLKSDNEGAAWSDAGISLGETAAGVTANGGAIYVAGRDRNHLTSTDTGQTWTKAGYKLGSGNLKRLARGMDRYVVVGDYGTGFSTDGQNWRMTASSGGFNDVAYGAGRFVAAVAAGNLGKAVRTSEDGLTWREITVPTTTDLYGIHYGNSMFVAVGALGKILTSPDAANWTDRSLASATLNSVTYGGGVWVVVGTSAGRRSADGVTWSTTSPGGTLRDVYHANGLFVAVGDSGAIRTSPDGQTWTSRTSGTTKNLNGVSYVGGKWVAVGVKTGSDESAVISTSSNGTTWTLETSNIPVDLFGVDRANGLAVVLGANASIQVVPFADTDSPLITAQPQGQNINAGQALNLSATVSGVSPVSFRWLRNGQAVVDGGNISGATTANLTITGATPANAGDYVLEVVNNAGTSLSLKAVVVVKLPPTIAAQPQSTARPPGAGATFYVQATGDGPFTYVWKKNGGLLSNGGNISGQGTSSLNVGNLQASDAGFYTVEVSNAAGTTVSQVAVLAVHTLAADTVQIGLDTQFNGKVPEIKATALRFGASTYSTNFNVEAGIVQPDGKLIAVGTFEYQNAASQTRFGIIRLNLDGTLDTGFNAPVLESLRGGSFYSAAALKDVALMSDGKVVVVGEVARVGGTTISSGVVVLNPDGTHASSFAPAGMGYLYSVAVDSMDRVVVAGYFNLASHKVIARLISAGAFDATFNTTTLAIDDFQADTLMIQQPNDKVLIHAYTDNYSDSKVIRLLNTGAADGSFTSLSFAGSPVYDLQLSPGGGILAPGSYFTVGGQSQRSMVRLTEDGARDTSLGNPVSTSIVSPSVNHAVGFANGAMIAGGGFRNIQSGTLSNLALLNPSGTLIASPVIGTGTDGSVHLVVGSPDRSSIYVAGNITNLNGVPVSRMIRLNAAAGSGGSLPLQIVSLSPSQAVTPGSTVILSVAATGTGSLGYQWKKNGGSLSGQTSSQLVLENIQAGSVGDYTVVVTDGTGPLPSSVITISLGVPQTFGQWLADKGLTTGVNDGAAQDPDNDGLPNIGEFAFGSHPNQNGSVNKPYPFDYNDGGTIYPSVRYTRNKLATGITIVVTAATDAGFVNPVNTTMLPPVDLGGDMEQVTIRANMPLSGITTLFFHVQVSQP